MKKKNLFLLCFVVVIFFTLSSTIYFAYKNSVPLDVQLIDVNDYTSNAIIKNDRMGVFVDSAGNAKLLDNNISLIGISTYSTFQDSLLKNNEQYKSDFIC